MTIENQNFEMYAGETKKVSFAITGGDDLATVTWGLAERPRLTLLLQKDSTTADVLVTPTQVTVLLSPEDTEDLHGGYHHELVGVDNDGKIAWMSTGFVVIKPTALKIKEES